MSNFRWIMVLLIVSLIAGLAGYNIGKAKRSGKIAEALTGVFSNIENYVIVLSIIVLSSSLVYSGTSEDNEFLSIVLNIFATIIFSWLLTLLFTQYFAFTAKYVRK